MKIHKEKRGLCRWKCGRKADNRSGICDGCWLNRFVLHAEYKAEEAAKPKRVLSDEQKAGMKAARKARIDAKIVTRATLGEKEG